MGADNYYWGMRGRGEVEAEERLRAENKRLREALEELNANANRVLAGDLSWLSRRDIAAAVADRSKAALLAGEETKR